jgi:hypothetical protein
MLLVSYWPIAAVSPRSGRYGRYRAYYGPIWFEAVIDRRAEAPAVSAIPAITTQHREGDQPPDRLLAIHTDSDQFGRVARGIASLSASRCLPARGRLRVVRSGPTGRPSAAACVPLPQYRPRPRSGLRGRPDPTRKRGCRSCGKRHRRSDADINWSLRGDRSEKLSFVYARALYSPTPRLQLLHSPKPVPL